MIGILGILIGLATLDVMVRQENSIVMTIYKKIRDAKNSAKEFDSRT